MDKLLLGEVFCIILLVSGCCSHKISFVGMTKKEVAIQQESAPRLKNGDFRILYMTSLENPNQLGHHFHKNKESLLKDPLALKSQQWQVFFHFDRDLKWHSYLLEFDDKNLVVKQSDRHQPHWTMAEQ